MLGHVTRGPHAKTPAAPPRSSIKSGDEADGSYIVFELCLWCGRHEVSYIMLVHLLTLCVVACLANAQNGYNYNQPQNPLSPPVSGSNQRETSASQSQGNLAAGGGGGGGDGGEHHHSSDDPLQWLRDSVPGEPGVDYPILSEVPETGFSCDGKVQGYYADAEAGCQPFHVCREMLGGEMMQMSFLCPNGTIFNQEGFACQWWNQVDCAASEQFYSKNEEIGKVPESAASNNVASSQGQLSQGNLQQQQSRPQNNYQQPQQQQSQQQNSYQQPQQQQQQRRPQQQQQQQQRRPQQQQQQQQRRPQQQQQQRRPQQPQRRPQQQQQQQNNGYVPPAQNQVTPPPALYGLPRN